MIDRLAALKRQYVATLPDKLASLRGIRDDLDRGYATADKQLRDAAHRLSGSGGSYGFPELSDVARDVEHASTANLRTASERLIDLMERIHRDCSLEQARILVVEDDLELAELVKGAFEPLTAEIHIAVTGLAAGALLQHLDFDLVVLDLMLPDVDGRSLLLELRQRDDTRDLPVIVLTAQGSALARTECITAGVDHFIDKPVDQAVLEAAVRASVHRATRRRAAARVDPQTGLPGRGVAHELLMPVVDRLRTLALVDIEHLDAVNRESGRAVGDRMLRALAAEIRQMLTETEIAVRWGGDEIVLVLEGQPEASRGRLEHLCATLERTEIDGARVRGVPVTAALVPWLPAETIDAPLGSSNRLIDLTRRLGTSRVGIADLALKGDILLVEDDPDSVALARSVLDPLGSVVTAADASAAIARLSEQPWQLVVLDWHLRGSSGGAVLEWLAANGRTEPVLLVTAIGEERLTQILTLGGDDYVQKPFAPHELAGRARRLLTRLRRAPEPPRGD